MMRVVLPHNNNNNKRLPAEWEPHMACIVLYPHNAGTFRLEQAQKQVRQVIQAIASAGQENVIVLCRTMEQSHQVQYELDHEDNNNNSSIPDYNSQRIRKKHIHVGICPSNDTWARDTAPTFVLRESVMIATTRTNAAAESTLQQQQQPQQQLCGLNWQFNGYGDLYSPYDLDQQLAREICEQLPNILATAALGHVGPAPIIKCQPVPLVLEGGSIHTDGQGTIITTKECLLHPSRNPHLSQEQIEFMILDATGCTHMIWLEHGLPNDDDTNGHIDNFCCFVAPTQVVLAWTDNDQQDPAMEQHYTRCRDALQVLESSHDALGRSLTVHKLHVPSLLYYTPDIVESLQSDPVHVQEEVYKEREGAEGVEGGILTEPRRLGVPMAASYINFYIANEAVIVPQFNDPIYDVKAIETLQALFPTRRVVGILSHEILIGGGNIHCITQQVPQC